MDEKILYLDCASGISGDMTVGALLDLGASREKLVRALDSLGVSGYHLHFGRTKKCGIDAYDFDVHLEEEEHHHDHEHGHEHEHSHDEHDHEHHHDHEHTHDHEHSHDHHDHSHCDHDHGKCDHGHDHAHHHAHDDDVKSFVYRTMRQIDPAKLEEFLGAIIQVYGPKLLRYKGVLDMKGTEKKVIFQGVHELMGTDLGPAWQKNEKRESKMVFIGIDLPQEILAQGLDRCTV